MVIIYNIFIYFYTLFLAKEIIIIINNSVFGVLMIIIFAKTDNFLVKIESCNFINNFYLLLYFG